MSALRGRQPARRGPAPRRGRRPREVPGCLVLLQLTMVDGPITY